MRTDATQETEEKCGRCSEVWGFNSQPRHLLSRLEYFVIVSLMPSTKVPKYDIRQSTIASVSLHFIFDKLCNYLKLQNLRSFKASLNKLIISRSIKTKGSNEDKCTDLMMYLLSAVASFVKIIYVFPLCSFGIILDLH